MARAVKLEAPPPRQRVIERDGKLVVIDSGAPDSPRSAGPAPSGWFQKTAFDGRGVLTTRHWYDDKGPRRLTVGGDVGRVARWAPAGAVIAVLLLAAAMFFLPWALIAIPALVQPKLWQKQRARFTAWLDRFPAAT
ncbi:hypothetical protein EAH87_13420 [Sphingomonas koreensis]|nr:hypothetical protein EAH87_13420 [Sphingomonas koreensis]